MQPPWMSRPTTSPARGSSPNGTARPSPRAATYTSSSSAKTRSTSCTRTSDSFGARKLTGRFAIETDEELGAIIYGNYDYSAGDWQHRYIVTDFSKTQMIWTAKDDRSDISVYERCDGIPEDITGGKTE